MRFLIICTYYPPDTTIGAVRPYMLAKYLSVQGHEVTVLRNGVFYRSPDPLYAPLEQVEVISYSGPDSDAERYLRGEYQVNHVNKEKRPTASKLPAVLYAPLVSLYSVLTGPFSDQKRIKKAKHDFSLLRPAIDDMFNKGYTFDCVFSTYSNLENIYGGEYAAKKFNASWIQDLRDPVTMYHRKGSFFWNINARKIQKYVLKNADLCTTVSAGLAEYLESFCPGSTVKEIYNGYDVGFDDLPEPDMTGRDKKLELCYTGSMYGPEFKALETLLCHIRNLSNEKKISLDNVSFVYAGKNSTKVKSYFDKYKLGTLFQDYGYITRSEVFELQKKTDAFLVFSWNTNNMRGVITGKFYEGIKSNKPIISVVAGNRPNSDLMLLNRKYGYGYCLELCSEREHGKGFDEFFLKMYDEKMKNGHLSYMPSEKLKNDFRYDHIASDLADIAEQIAKK